jgi:hypothetical protein
MLLQEHTRNDEAGNHKKDIDAEESGMETWQVRVIPNNQSNGQCPEGLDVGAKGSGVPIRRAGPSLEFSGSRGAPDMFAFRDCTEPCSLLCTLH